MFLVPCLWEPLVSSTVFTRLMCSTDSALSVIFTLQTLEKTGKISISYTNMQVFIYRVIYCFLFFLCSLFHPLCVIVKIVFVLAQSPLYKCTVFLSFRQVFLPFKTILKILICKMDQDFRYCFVRENSDLKAGFHD